MAELLGTIASGIAVGEIALKVGGTLFKLHELWKEVQKVPDAIQELLQEIEVYGPLLDGVESGFDMSETLQTGNYSLETSNRAHGRAAAALCREPLQKLRQLVEDLSNEISSARRLKRNISKVKVLLKKDDVKKFQDRLQKSLSLLNLAQQSYLV